MFKNVIFSLVSLLVGTSLLVSTSSVNAADMKIGIINERLVLSKAPQLELVESKLKKQFEDRINEIKALKEKGVAMQEKGQRDAVTMTEAEGIKLNRELADLSQSLKSKDKNLQEDFQRAKREELQKVQVKIQQIVNKIAKEEKFDLIFRIESVAFRKEATDISNKVITILSNPAG